MERSVEERGSVEERVRRRSWDQRRSRGAWESTSNLESLSNR